MVMNVNDGPSFVRPQPMRNGFEISFFLSSICCFPRAVLRCAVLCCAVLCCAVPPGGDSKNGDGGRGGN